MFNMTMVFQNCGSKLLIKAFLVPNLRVFIFAPNLDKFEGDDFKYENGFFEFQSENTQVKHFFSLDDKYFLLLHKTSLTEKVEGVDFENGNIFFQIPAKEYPSTNLFSVKL